MGATDHQEGTVPVQGIPVQSAQAVPQQPLMQTVVVTVEDPAGPQDHFYFGCLASGLCGCLGLIGQRLCCPTLRGNFGGCTGCVINTTLGLIATVLLLVLEQSLDLYKFDRAALTESECDTYKGVWVDGICRMSECPAGYQEEGTETSYGVQTCSLKHVLLVIRIIQLAVASCVLAIAVMSCLKYRRQLTQYSAQGQNRPLMHNVYQQVQQPNAPGAVAEAC